MAEETDIQFVTVFASSNHDAEAEAEIVLALLQSAEIGARMVRQNVVEIPAGKVSVKVPAEQAESARRVIEAGRREGDQHEDSQ